MPNRAILASESEPRRLPVIDGNERPDICTPCGGKCCQQWPGVPHPDDMGSDVRAAVRALLATSRWVIDHDSEGRFDGEPGAWYPRPAMTDEVGTQPPWYGFRGPGTCTFLSGGQCEIYEDRPRGCRLVVPTDGGRCPIAGDISKATQVDEWEQHEDMLLELRSEFA